VILLDTTALVYAKGSEHPFREPCRELISAVAEGRLEATTTVEAIQEFAHVRAQRRGRTDAAALAGDYADLLSPLISATADHLLRGLKLFEQAPALGAFDAVLAAIALDCGADALVSVDAAFSTISGLRHVVPDAGGVATLLGR
jgi:predicted nucleic acid-binding protein